MTHRRPSETAPALGSLVKMAQDAQAVLRLDPEETQKHQLEPAPWLELDASVRHDVDICFALGGDGTILNALRTYAGTGVPVFGVNFGEIGFAFRISATSLVVGMGLAVLMGVAGGVFPAFRAARMPITSALRDA